MWPLMDWKKGIWACACPLSGILCFTRGSVLMGSGPKLNLRGHFRTSRSFLLWKQSTKVQIRVVHLGNLCNTFAVAVISSTNNRQVSIWICIKDCKSLYGGWPILSFAFLDISAHSLQTTNWFKQTVSITVKPLLDQNVLTNKTKFLRSFLKLFCHFLFVFWIKIHGCFSCCLEWTPVACSWYSVMRNVFCQIFKKIYDRNVLESTETIKKCVCLCETKETMRGLVMLSIPSRGHWRLN